ncbi:MAG: right-handed parallel beta-helix repeat-containing protein, partial [Candidatus Micrarchaeia archaeon]
MKNFIKNSPTKLTLIISLILFFSNLIFAVSYISNCGTLSTVGETYILTSNVSSTGTCFTIAADNVTLDCQGYTINHTGSGSGISASGRTNITIKNCNIIGQKVSNNYGIYFSSTTNSFILNNNLSSNYYGIYLDSSSNNILSNITASSNEYGIYLSSSSNNTLSNIPTSSNGGSGIYLSSSSNNTLSNITTSSNTYNGILLYSSSNNILSNITTSSNGGNGIYLASSSNNTLSNITTSSNYYGIYLYYSSNYNTLSNITASSNYVGIYLYYSSNYNTLSNITTSSNGYSGIVLYSSSNNLFFNNFFNNSNNVYFENSGENFWNTTLNCSAGPNIVGGPCIGGNFYATPSGTGFSETCNDVKSPYGICDTQYNLASNNVDYLPLTYPPIQLTSCGTLDKTGKTYLLIQNVTTSNDCFIINKSY